MTSIIGLRRSRNGHALYCLIHDAQKKTLTVRQMPSWATESVHCRTIHYTTAEEYAHAVRVGRNLCSALSRMSPTEERRQNANIMRYGEIV